MNPFAHILASLSQHVTSYKQQAPSGAAINAQQMQARGQMGPMPHLQSQGTDVVTPMAKQILSGFHNNVPQPNGQQSGFAHPQQGPQVSFLPGQNAHSTGNPSPQQPLAQGQGSNPFLALLLNRMGAGQQGQMPQMQMGQQNHAQALGGNFNAPNLVMQQPSQIQSQLVMPTERQGEGDFIQ